MGRGKESLLREQSLLLSLEEIGLEEGILKNHRGSPDQKRYYLFQLSMAILFSDF